MSLRESQEGEIKNKSLELGHKRSGEKELERTENSRHRETTITRRKRGTQRLR